MMMGRRLRSALAIVLALTFVIPTSYINTTHSTSDVSDSINITDTVENNSGGSNTTIDYLGMASLMNTSSQDIVYELTDDMLSDAPDNTVESEKDVVEVKVTELDISTLTEEELGNALKNSTMSEIGEWLYNLSEEDFNKVISFDTILNQDTLITNIDEDITDDNETLVYWEACQAVWFNSQISLMSWTDRFYGGRSGDARFYMNLECDDKLIRTYMIDVPNVVQGDDGTAIDMSLALITCTYDGGACDKGHNIDIKFTRIQKVTDSDDYWSGIRLYGYYNRPAGYKVTDYATNEMRSGTYGFGAAGYSRFGTVTFGELDYSNPYVLDAKYYTTEIKDEFVFEGNMFQIGLTDGLSPYKTSNFGASNYFICLDPSSKTYIVNPNGGYYEGSKSNKSYTKYLTGIDDRTTITVPVWQSETEGKSFTGWKLDGKVYTVESDGSYKEITSNVINTSGEIEVWHAGGKNGKYKYPDTYRNLYTSSIYYEDSGDATLTAQWKVDWIRVNFDGNKPVEETKHEIENLTPEYKQVWVGKEYGELPTPTLYGYKFLGWYTKPALGDRVTANTICNVTETHTLYARWEDIQYNVKFDLNKPRELASTEATGMAGYEDGKEIWYDHVYGYLPDKGNNNWPTPSLGSLTFDGWYTSPVGGIKVTASTKVTTNGDHTVYAHWSQQLILDSEVNLSLNPTTIGGVTFHKGGVDLDWQDYYKTSAYYHAYRRLSGTTTWTQTTPGAPADPTKVKIKTKYWADSGANDLAKPNAVSNNTVIQSKVTNNTRVSFSKPKDNGTKYDFYVKETSYNALGVVGDYKYTGSYQTFQAPIKGKYSFECWGAAGGPDWQAIGGKGGYTYGELDLNAGQAFYVYCGQKGQRLEDADEHAYLDHYFNGGGGPSHYGCNGTGGGATDFRTTNGNWDNATGLKNRIMVAGGGGGGGKWPQPSSDFGGHGGGLNGISAISGTNGVNNGGSGGGQGGTQTSAGLNGGFGYGGMGNWEGGGGGGGWYGGGAGTNRGKPSGSTSTYDYGGGGGSSYISGLSGCTNSATGWKFSNAKTIAGNASQPKPDGTGNQTGHSGEGRAIVKLMADYTDVTYNQSNITTETVTSGVKGYRYIIDKVANTTIAYNTGTFTTKQYIDVPNQTYGQYLHIATQDEATNISATIHVYIEPTYTITYELHGGTCKPENPGGYTVDTPTFTLVNPTKEGYTFIGWTGSNGSTPQMEVTIPIGSTGNKSYEAHWAGNTPYVSDFTLEGDVYEYATRHYYVKQDKVFGLKLYSYVKDLNGNIIGTVVYTPTNNYINVKDRDEKYIQSRNASLPMADFINYISTWDYQDAHTLKVLDSTVNTRTTTPYGSTDGYKYMNTEVKAKLTNHLDKVILFPQAGVDNGSTINKSEQFPEAKKVIVVADGKAPIITDNIIDDGVYDEKILPITVKINDEDTGESGIKNLKIEVENADSGYKETICNITNTSYVTNTSFNYKNSNGGDGLIVQDNENYVGKIKITITATDNVNNISTVEKTVYVISLDTEIKRMLPIVDINGNPIPDNIFKDGEQGELVIGTTGFIDEIDIEFDTNIQELASQQGYEIGSDVIIPLPNNGDNKNIHIRTTPKTDPDTLKPERVDEYFFTIPIGTWKPDASVDENTYCVVIRAHKDDKILSNILVFGGTGEGDTDGDGIPDTSDPDPNVPDDNPVTDDNFIVDGSFATELRTRIRDGIN